MEDIYAEIRRRFFNCIDKRRMTDRPYAALLSGGLDSSLVCGGIKYRDPDAKFTVFTITSARKKADRL